MTRTDALGALAAVLLFLGMFAGLFGAVAKWGTRYSCSKCGWEGEWEGSTCPRCFK